MYHYVRQIKDSRYPAIKGLEADLFYAQLEYLDKHYTFISIRQLISAIENAESLPSKSVLLTFNDSYKDHFQNVFPALESRGIQGCFYPEIAAVRDQKIILNHKLHFILAEASEKSEVVEMIFACLDELRDQFKLESNEHYFKKLAVASKYDSKQIIFIKRLLQTVLEKKVSRLIVDRLFRKFVGLQEKVFAKELYLNGDQIKCMLRNGMHFGILGYTHPRYDRLSRTEQQKELIKARDYLIELGVAATELTASYPWGVYNSDTLDILDQLNCKVAFTTSTNVADIEKDSSLELPRLDTNEIPKKADVSTNNWYNKA